MFKSYFTVAIRGLLRHKFYAVLNIVGLAIGVGCFLVAVLYLDHGFKWESHHENLDQIYRVVREVTDGGGKRFEPGTRPVAALLEAEFPEVLHAVKMLNREMWVYADDVGFNEMTCIATKNIVDVFTYPLAKGDAKTGLDRPFTCYITETLAEKLFGEQDAIGRIVSVHYKWLKRRLRSHGRFEGHPDGDQHETSLRVSHGNLSRRSVEIDRLGSLAHQLVYRAPPDLPLPKARCGR